MYDKLYASLYRIRRVEETVARVYPTEKIKSPVHLSIGQESIAVGVCEALSLQDAVFGTYRSHAAYLAKGGDLKAMIAELYGKSTGCSKGKGGSMHLFAPAVNCFGTSAVVGTTIPHGVGYAYAMKLLHRKTITVVFFGDGATDEGVYHESLNFAALKQLPVIFVCENNGYAIHTHFSRRQSTPLLCERARTYGMPAERIDDGDVLRIHECVSAMVKQLRAGQLGPFYLECLTYRWKEHVGPNDDWQLGYRMPAEAALWKATDQVTRVAALIEPSRRFEIEQAVEAEIEAAFAFAEASPFPDVAQLWADVYKEG